MSDARVGTPQRCLVFIHEPDPHSVTHVGGAGLDLPILAIHGDGVVPALRHPEHFVELFFQPRHSIDELVTQCHVASVVCHPRVREVFGARTGPHRVRSVTRPASIGGVDAVALPSLPAEICR